jgi:hypothetical protein
MDRLNFTTLPGGYDEIENDKLLVGRSSESNLCVKYDHGNTATTATTTTSTSSEEGGEDECIRYRM